MALRTIAIIDQALQIVLLLDDLWGHHPDLLLQVVHQEQAEQVAVEEEDNCFNNSIKKEAVQ